MTTTKVYTRMPADGRHYPGWTPAKVYFFTMDEHTGEWITDDDDGRIRRVSFEALKNPNHWEKYAEFTI